MVLCGLARPCLGHDRSDTIMRPQPEGGGATRVHVAMGLLDVDEIDGADQNLTVNLVIQARWDDPRLAHPGPGDLVLPLQDVWHPELLFVNQQRIWSTFPRVARVAPSGMVEFRQRVWGPFSQPLDFREFPFDRQDLEMRVGAFGFRPHEIVFEADPEAPSGLASAFSLPDWGVTGWHLDFTPYDPLAGGRGTASFAMVLVVDRYASHYLWKVILPLILIVAMSSIVFWIDPREGGTQIGVSTTSMLTLIAYRFAVGSQIPAVPYLTRMDHFILGSTLLVFAALVQAVMTSVMHSKNQAERARRFDRICRVLFPAVFLVMVYVTLAAPYR